MQGFCGRIDTVTNCFGPSAIAAVPDDIATLKAALAEAELRADLAEAEAARGKALASNAEARMAVFQFIEGWYNPARRHSALDYQSPINYESRVQTRLESASP